MAELPSAGPPSAASPIAETRGGRVRGAARDGVLSFLGIPYATAPRFAPPEPAPSWDGVRDALSPGPAAPQPARPVARFTHGDLPETDEQCLALNVFTPSLDGARPVLVWVHGGGFAIGHAAASIYDGRRLAAAADAVVVTVNYRLGSLGWLWHPELASAPGEPAGNWGLLDQLAALRWVRENVAGFGGDPSRVTAAGQSAGALSLIDLLVTTEGRTPFTRAILQSPPLGDLAQPPAVAQRWAEALSELAGGRAGLDAELLGSLPAERVVALHEQLLETPAWRGTRGGALPTLDPATLVRSPLEDPGVSGAVDVLIGANAAEGTFFFDAPWRPPPPPARAPSIAEHLTGDPGAFQRYAERARASGTPDDATSVLVALGTDAIVAEPAARWAQARATAGAGADAGAGAGGRVYRYRVDHPGAGPRLKATHTAEVPLLFGTWADDGPGERLGGQAPGAGEVSGALVGAWAAFLRGGDPGWAPLGPARGMGEIGVFGSGRPFAVEPAASR